MTVFWVDIHPTFQAGFDPALLRPAGCVALVCKVTEGNGWYRDGYRTIADKVMRHDIGFAAYHFLRSESGGAVQARWTKEMMGDHWGNVPVMLDWETSTAGTFPSYSTARDYVDETRRLGGRITMNYFPRWYWEQIGKPTLTQPPFDTLALVQSRYGGNPAGGILKLYPGDQSDRWAGYADRGVDVLQFGSRCRIPGWDGALDINAYRGTEQQLRRSGLFHWAKGEKTMPEWNEHNKVPADLVTHFPAEANITTETQLTFAGLLWRAILYPLQIRARIRDLERVQTDTRRELEELRNVAEETNRDVAELLALIKGAGGGNPDTATIVEAIRTDGAQTREEAVGAVIAALREGTGHPQ